MNNVKSCDDSSYMGYIEHQNIFQYSNGVNNNHLLPTAPPVSHTVHVNPHFKKKVFLNPKFQYINSNGLLAVSNKPIVQTPKNIHINPNMLKNVSLPDISANTQPMQTYNTRISNKLPDSKLITDKENTTIYASKTKLIRTPIKYIQPSINTKYKLVKSLTSTFSSTKVKPLQVIQNPGKNRFKLDNRVSIQVKNKKTLSPKKLYGVVNKSSIRVQKAANKKLSGSITSFKVQNNVCGSKYKLIRNVSNKSGNSSPKASITPNKWVAKKSESPKRYVKTGRYRLVAIGAIPLCIKFLQGACANKSCRRSHNVTHDQMPTCKFYLEGNCSKDNCPYLHVKISPKADICRKFLRGVCRKGEDCNCRHQLLCPEYEKTGICIRRKCLYPHLKAVKKLTALKSEKLKIVRKSGIKKSPKRVDKINKKEVKKETVTYVRYYKDESVLEKLKSNENCFQEAPAKVKFGRQPSFISFT